VLEREHGDRAESLVQAWIDGWIQHGPLTLDLNEELENISCSTLVIQGERDEFASSQHAKDIAARIDKAILWLIPEVGHMPPQEISEEFNRTIIDFLKENITQEAQMERAGSESENVY
jgi:pimeloyl-ACP methyl ester carboxylesterase